MTAGMGTVDEIMTVGIGTVVSRSNALGLSNELEPSSARVNCSGSESERGALTVIPGLILATGVETMATAAATAAVMAGDITTTAKWRRVIVMG
jgi:hypothetical protein